MDVHIFDQRTVLSTGLTPGIYRHGLRLQIGSKILREYYDKLANRYDELYGIEQSTKHLKVLEYLRGRTDRVILDVGCGDGTLLSQTISFASLATGLDISGGMLARARKTLGRSASLVRADGHSLPFRDESVDCVLSVSLAEKKNASHLMSEAWRVMKDQGIMAMTVFHGEGPENPSFRDFGKVERDRLTSRETLLVLRKSNGPTEAYP